MKKILFMTNHLQYSNGVATVLKSIANELVRRGFDVDIVCLFLCEDEWVKNELDERVKVKRVFKTYFRGFARLVDMIPDSVLYRKIVKEKYDVEVAFQFGMPTKILSASKNPNKVAWIHGYGEEYLKRHEKFSKIVTCAAEAAERYKKAFRYPERVTYLYNPVDEKIVIEKSERECAVKKENGKFIFGTVGRLSPEKGYDRLIKIYAKIADKVENSELWIIGNGPEEEKLKSLVKETGTDGRVKLFGRQTNPYNFMKQFDVFVCSSYSEGMSTVCTEALMLGVPCVSTLVGGSEELIEKYGCGVVARSDEEFEKSLLNVYENRDLLENYKSHIGDNDELLYDSRVNKIVGFFETSE